MIIIITTAITYTSFSMNQLTQAAQTVEIKQTSDFEKTTEKFDVATIGKVNNQFNMTVTNRGDIPVHLTRLWVENTTDSSWPVSKYNLDIAIPSGGSAKNIGQNIGLTALDTQSYVMKLVTERGNTQKIFVNSVGTESIYLSLSATPTVITTAFSTTLALEVINTGTNKLINLEPYMDIPVPSCAGTCSNTLTSGPTPAQFDSLDPGDIAIFRWVYKLNGDADDTFTFTGSLQNGVAGNDDSTTVTIDVPEFAENSGVSLESLGFGQTTTVDNVFVMHGETDGIPSAGDYQLAALLPDSLGTTLTFNDTSDSFEFFSANVTATDAHFPAGNWNASLRYYSEHLPTAMNSGADIIWGNGDDGGMKLHFEDISESTGLYDSGEDSTCYTLATSGSAGVTGAIHSTTMGVNGSGAYDFDGTGDYLRVTLANDGTCNNIHHEDYSIAFWFKSTALSTWHDEQVIYYLWDDEGVGNMGGVIVEIGDGTSDNHGRVFFTNADDVLAITTCEGDEPDGNGGDNYIDGEWHHFAVEMNDKTCKLYLDGILKDTTTGAGETHWDASGNDVYIGANEFGTEEFFGYIDDIMFWMDYKLTQSDITALVGYSFGNNSTNFDFVISNYTDAGVLSNTIVTSNDYGLKWSDQGHYSSDNDIWAGGNYTVSLPEVRLNLVPDNNRLGFTMSYASGEPLYLNIDDSDLDGTGSNLLSTYLQPTSLIDPQVMPIFYTWDNDDAKVKFFAFSSGNEGAWFTFQGTRIIFNGTNGNYAGLVDTISDGTNTVTMSITTDSPFIGRNNQADINFWPPQSIPLLGAPPTEGDKIIAGTYDVTVFMNGYDEDGTVFIRSMNLGTITVLE